MECGDCVWRKAWIDGQCCPFYQLGMCDSQTKKKYEKELI